MNCSNCNDGVVRVEPGFPQTRTSPAEPPSPVFCEECPDGRRLAAEEMGEPICSWCGEPVGDHEGPDDFPALAEVSLRTSLVEALCELQARRDGWPETDRSKRVRRNVRTAEPGIDFGKLPEIQLVRAELEKLGPAGKEGIALLDKGLEAIDQGGDDVESQLVALVHEVHRLGDLAQQDDVDKFVSLVREIQRLGLTPKVRITKSHAGEAE
jgi:hypothetical protein